MDITALRISKISEWLNIILHPRTVGISSEDSHLFQILLWLLVITSGALTTKLIMMVGFLMLYLYLLLSIELLGSSFQHGHTKLLLYDRFGKSQTSLF
jgi:hypothetical protein